MMRPVYVDEYIADAVAKVSAKLTPALSAIDPNITGVHFYQGHPREIVLAMKELSEDAASKKSRYPAVWLFRDFPEEMTPQPGIFSRSTVRLFIVTRTDPTKKTEWRKEHSFKPILHPIYFELLNQFQLSGNFPSDGFGIGHRKVDHYFWGRQGLFDKDENFFTDFLDCVELENLNLLTYLKKC